ncbi:MAG: hypothetical protein AMJ46_02100 [Latescibacteria bacterium DG_63]|nr:MAG: hypothetical protein AMJ46_02100 [Latescibacteria bacterium DG_63]
MKAKASTLLRRLEKLKTEFDRDTAGRKLDLLDKLARRRLANADQVCRLHEFLAFSQAYPDSRRILAQVERMLAEFASRGDLRRHRRALADTGIAGTDIYYRFFWPSALWLVKRFPDYLTIDWPEFSAKRRMADLLFILMPYSESPALEGLNYSPREWVDRLKGGGETDAAFLVRRFAALKASTFARERLFEELDVPMRLAPGPGTPTRTRAKLPEMPVVFQTKPLSRTRPDMRKEIQKPPLRVRSLSPREGQRMLDAAFAAMITRSRDLDAFDFGDKSDVRLIDCGEGLQFACIGQIPERRLLLEAVYGFLTIKNGVPIGYVLSSSLFSSSEIAYNVFETYRGTESVRILGRVLAMVRYLFGSNTFSIDPYQLGHNNPEGLKSGAWWFYYKLGFRPEDPDVLRLLRTEQRRMREDSRHRSSRATLQKLSSEPLFLYLDAKKRDVFAKIPVAELGLKISRLLAERSGADREKAIRTASREAAKLLGVRAKRTWSAGERLAWERWSPLILLLPGISRWKDEEKRALVQVVRAKGGRRESDFVTLFNRHRRLRQALLTVVEEAP